MKLSRKDKGAALTANTEHEELARCWSHTAISGIASSLVAMRPSTTEIDLDAPEHLSEPAPPHAWNGAIRRAPGAARVRIGG